MLLQVLALSNSDDEAASTAAAAIMNKVLEYRRSDEYQNIEAARNLAGAHRLRLELGDEKDDATGSAEAQKVFAALAPLLAVPDANARSVLAAWNELIEEDQALSALAPRSSVEGYVKRVLSQNGADTGAWLRLDDTMNLSPPDPPGLPAGHTEKSVGIARSAPYWFFSRSGLTLKAILFMLIFAATVVLTSATKQELLAMSAREAAFDNTLAAWGRQAYDDVAAYVDDFEQHQTSLVAGHRSRQMQEFADELAMMDQRTRAFEEATEAVDDERLIAGLGCRAKI